ncbi:hypothetical protein P305_07660 [Xylella fastidiosa subsp. fastidiosa Mus-1]|nr:hypothetical protein P305_07660 [Xylella fastidiosa subsp. fastidiosa Mus-1]
MLPLSCVPVLAASEITMWQHGADQSLPHDDDAYNLG